MAQQLGNGGRRIVEVDGPGNHFQQRVQVGFGEQAAGGAVAAGVHRDRVGQAVGDRRVGGHGRGQRDEDMPAGFEFPDCVGD